MIQQRLAFDAADAAAPEPREPPPVRERQTLADFLDEVTRRVRQAAERGRAAAPTGAGASPEAGSVTALRHTVRNAQMIAARARRAIDALPGTDLELLRALQGLQAATREAHETRRAAEFAGATQILRPTGERA